MSVNATQQSMDLPLQPQNSDPLVSLTRNVFNRGSVRKEVQRSPLRYPGGKSRAISSILALIPDNTDEICSPFFGGGSIELACAARGIHVFGSDLFEPLVNFWQCLLTNPSALADATVAYLPLPKARFYKLQKSYYSIPSALERAAVFFVLNRASYSGATLAGGMSPGHPRFTESSIQRVRSFHVDKVNVDHLDFRDAIAANPAHRLMYLDPPYMIASDNLYGYRGDMHSGFDHIALAELLGERSNWILSYNDCPEIRAIYSDYRMLKPSWIYGMSNDKNSRELLIVNI